MTHHVDLKTVVLSKGSHASRDEGVCLLELAAWWAGEPHSDHPGCVPPTLAAFGREWQDALDHETRQKLKAYVPRLVGASRSAEDEPKVGLASYHEKKIISKTIEERRGWLATDWLVRSYAPAWLELAGLTEHALALRGLPELTTDELAEAARDQVEAARSATRSAARTAVISAAYRAAYGAAESAAPEVLAPTVAALQVSAFGLLDRLINVGRVEASHERRI